MHILKNVIFSDILGILDIIRHIIFIAFLMIVSLLTIAIKGY